MNEILHRLASMKVAVSLLIVIVVALAAGTFVESASGSPAALRLVYHAAWFRLLLGLFALNVACSLWDTWPWEWRRSGFVLTHAAMLVVLAGALITDRLKVEGQLALWEGEEQQSFLLSGPGRESVALPFRVKLDSFEIDYHQGTLKPAMFRSRVTVTDPPTGRWFPAVIQMNQELTHGGYSFYQSSYKQTQERDQTILTVSRDPGRPIVFAGYVLLMAGMVVVLGTRMAQRRAAALTVTRHAGGRSRRAAAAVLAAAAAWGAWSEAGAAAGPSPAEVERLRRLPVQHDGRVMPLDTMARDVVWKVTGVRERDGARATAMVAGWTLDPERWGREPIVPLGPELARAASLPTGNRASFLALVESPGVMGLFNQARATAQRAMPLGPLLQQAQKAEERLVVFQPFLQQRGLPAIPAKDDPSAAWSPAPHAHGAAELASLLDGPPTAPAEAMRREILYNAVQPSRLSWWILSMAALLSLAAWIRPSRLLDAGALAGLVAGSCVMTWGLAVRWQVAGRIPASNMYESLLFLGWGVGLFALAALIVLRSRLVVLNAAAMAALTMALADNLPVDPFIRPMPPVLAGTPWLAIHVPIIMVSYSVLALGVLVAHLQIGVCLFVPLRRDLMARLGDMLYWYMHAGSILLIAGILTGSIWAASSWGRYWGWDPKEVWSLIAFLAYMAILHGRFDGLVGEAGVAALSIVAFWTILMTYVGVNFVLGSGLHAYGSGGSGVVTWMALVAAAEMVFLGSALMAHLTRRGAGVPARA
ncbi:MAG TPA: cytochrome c biogenesis protein CcsA [Candidatus Polarisedimenticolia bacterium]|nr:cytochrome c biogenesis protein CcsA [Candidatus Polarisedimenticolia bacterium]